MVLSTSARSHREGPPPILIAPPRILGAVSIRPRAMLERCSRSRCADAADHGMHAASVENSSVRTDTPYLN
eukprot:SAG31_NODE_38971_length_291_cov_8.729167_1_plen_70_part_10